MLPKINWKLLTPAQRKDLTERRKLNLESGSYNHAQPPYGYRFVKDKQGFRSVMVDSKVAPIIHDAYQGIAYADLNSRKEVAEYLSARLHKKLSPAQALELIQDVRNIGYYRLPESLGGKFKKAHNFKSTVVTEELFTEAVSRTLEESW